MAGKPSKGASAPFSLSYLQQYLNYDSDTGMFTWKVDRKNGQIRAGDVAGSLTKTGYIEISLKNKRMYAHRLAWYFITGSWPTNEIDHIDQIKTNNAGCNLREADSSQNSANVAHRSDNTSGFKGVSKQTGRDTWVAETRFKGVRKRKGGFATPEAAHEWIVKIREQLHGEFASK